MMTGVSLFRRRRPQLRGRRGGIALTFGLLAVPLTGLLGLSIDFGITIMARARMALSADTAVLAAARTTANAFVAGATNYLAQGQSVGVTWFNAQAGTTTGLNMGTPVMTVTQNGGVFTAEITYSGAMLTNVASFFGYPTFPVSGAASATITVGGYADINILMDVSSSMGIAGTQAGINELGPLALAYNSSMAQGQDCAFGCHWDANNNDFYGLARKNNIPLRIDVLISAVQSVITQLISQDVNSIYRVGLYSFDSGFTTNYAVSSNLSAALTAAQKVTVPLCCGGNNNDNLEPDTNYPAAMQSMTTVLGTSGNGSSQSATRKFLFLVTDGVTDYLNSGGQRILQNMTASACSAMKANGVTILVLYTEYPNLDPNAYYEQNVQYAIQPNIISDLTACASAPEYFFLAADSTSIQSQMQKMLQVATATEARLLP